VAREVVERIHHLAVGERAELRLASLGGREQVARDIDVELVDVAGANRWRRRERALLDLKAPVERVTGFEAIRSVWLARAARLGEVIEVRLPDRMLSGVFVDIDVDGALILETPDGLTRIAAGDVFFREAA